MCARVTQIGAAQPRLFLVYAAPCEAVYSAFGSGVFCGEPSGMLDELADVYAELREFNGLDLAARALAPK